MNTDLSTIDQLSCLTETEAAIIAAAQATEATAELLRFAREGGVSDASAFDTEVTAKLAEALKLAIDIEGEAAFLDDEEGALRNQLANALSRFIEGWVG
jgi:hypothetical protein